MGYAWAREATRKPPGRRARPKTGGIVWPRLNCSLPTGAIHQLKVAIGETVYAVPWMEGLFQFTRRALAIAGPSGIDKQNALDCLEDAAIAWGTVYGQIHGSRPTRGELLGAFAEQVHAVRFEVGQSPTDQRIAAARNPTTWPDEDDRPAFNHACAICVQVANPHTQEFYLPGSVLARELGLPHRRQANRLLNEMASGGLIIKTGKQTAMGSTIYRLGQRLAWHLSQRARSKE